MGCVRVPNNASKRIVVTMAMAMVRAMLPDVDPFNNPIVLDINRVSTSNTNSPVGDGSCSEVTNSRRN